MISFLLLIFRGGGGGAGRGVVLLFPVVLGAKLRCLFNVFLVS